MVLKDAIKIKPTDITVTPSKLTFVMAQGILLRYSTPTLLFS